LEHLPCDGDLAIRFQLLISEKARSRIADEQLRIAAVHPQHFNRLVTSLIADFKKAHAALDGGHYETGSQAMCTEGRHVEAKPSSALLDDHSHGAAMQSLVGNALIELVEDADEQWATYDPSRFDPCLQCRNRAGCCAPGDGNGLAKAFLIGLAAPDVDHHTLASPFQIGNIQRHKFGSAHGRGKADEQNCAITQLP
jgi:hypothetical protein